MSVKILLLKSGEEVITEVKEMYDPDTNQPIGYHMYKPFRLDIISDAETGIVLDRNKGYQLHWFPWAPLSKDKDFFLPGHHVLTAYEPLDSIADQYLAAIQNDIYEKNFRQHEAMIAGEVGEMDMEKIYAEAQKILEDEDGSDVSDSENGDDPDQQS